MIVNADGTVKYAQANVGYETSNIDFKAYEPDYLEEQS